MNDFYRKASLATAGVILLSLVVVLWGVDSARLSESLVPGPKINFLMKPVTVPESSQGKTRLQVKTENNSPENLETSKGQEESKIIEYEFFLDSEQQFPYAHYAQYFVNARGTVQQVDLTAFKNLSFTIACTPKNVLMFVMFSADDKLTKLNDISTARVSAAAFSCSPDQSTVNIELEDLIAPDWWLNQHGYDYSDTGYRRDKVMGVAWVTTFQSPADTLSSVNISGVTLSGYRPGYLYIAISICVILWISFFVSIMRSYVKNLALAEVASTLFNAHEQEKLGDKNHSGLLSAPAASETLAGSGKKIAAERAREKEKALILSYLAKKYADAALSLEMAISELGINRNKINDILKEEVGLTFSAYLNHLRLAEAERLLAEGKTNISEIAYSVGYSNVSYFNKLFKKQFGCAPTQYRFSYPSSELHHP